jgi:hypothetical protein
MRFLSVAEKTEFINYTLRFPEEYRKRLEMEAHVHGRSLNQQIIRVLEIYFAGAGYPGSQICSGGQIFELHSALAHDTPAETVWEIVLENFKTGKEEARYLIGVHRSFIRDLKVSDNLHAAKEVGLALLAFHAKKGRDIRNLRWNQNPSFSEKRLIFSSEISEGIGSLPDFLEIMFRGHWEDRLLVPDDEMEAIKTLLLMARLEKCPIVNNMADPHEMWVEVGREKFNDPNRSVYTQALGKMELMGLIELQPGTEVDFNRYVLTPEGVQYLVRLASFST